jgi:hypothetical protein
MIAMTGTVVDDELSVDESTLELVASLLLLLLSTVVGWVADSFEE